MSFKKAQCCESVMHNSTDKVIPAHLQMYRKLWQSKHSVEVLCAREKIRQCLSSAGNILEATVSHLVLELNLLLPSTDALDLARVTIQSYIKI